MKPSELLTKDDLNQFKKELVELLDERIKSLVDDKQLNKKWLRNAELAEYLGLSTSQISVLKAEGVIKCSKLGGTNYFNKEEIDRYLENQEGNNV